MSFAGEDESLVHGNEILAGQIVGYERQKRLRQSDRTFDNIVAAVRKLVGNAPWYPEVLRALAHYLVFDALICNTDRHHENWGFLTQFEEVEPEKWMMRLRLAPSFDHASWPLPSFPEFNRKYESSELFPHFQNRVLDPGRKDFATYLESLDLSPTTIDPIEILSVSGGERQTDNLEVFPRIEPRPDGVFLCRFFLHGWRHMPEIAQKRALSLGAGEELGISLELTNPSDPVAIQVTTRDYAFVGWTPRYLVSDLLMRDTR